jgi:imidazole glycerol-phosphate synthase subunit HisF
MRFIRIIPKLDIKNGLLIKGINLEGLRVLGDPYNFAKYYFDQGADEICYIDNVATLYGTNNLSKFVKRTAQNIFIPLAVGGGIRSINDIEDMLRNGADKVCINSAVIDNKNFLKKAVKEFGSSTITVVIESNEINGKYFISKSNGRDLINIKPDIWAKELEDLGAGEIFLTSVNREGLKAGFDIKITEKVSSKVKIPVIAHGGAGSLKHIYEVIKNTNINGVSFSSIIHYEACNLFPKKKSKIFDIGNTFFISNKLNKKKPINYLKLIKKYLLDKKIYVRN